MFKKVSIIGCGLIGSSILRAMIKKRISKKICIYDSAKEVRRKIKKLKFKARLENSLSNSVKDSDLIILCAPISSYKFILQTIKDKIKLNAIIIDVGSVKNISINVVEDYIKKNNNSWIPCHPISGSEVTGPENGSSSLFEKKWCIITPSKKYKNSDLKKIIIFWKKLGAVTKIMSSQEHDRVFSITSHLPHIIAYNLVKTAMDLEKKGKSEIVNFSAGGLRDFSRIAASNEIMWRDVSISNSKFLIKNINFFIKNLIILKKLMVDKKGEDLKKIFRNTKVIRKKIVSAKQDINLPDFGRR